MAENEKIQKLIDDIIAEDKITNEELKDMFEGYQCYMSKDEFGILVDNLFLETTNDRMKIILNSRKGKMYSDYRDEYGDSILNLFIVKAVRSQDKRNAISVLFDLIEDEELELKWDIINANYENALHVVCLIANFLTKDEILRFLNLFDKHDFNPFNKDDMNRNAISLFTLDNKHLEEESIEIVKKLEEMSKKFIIEVDNYVEDEVEVTVNAEV